MNTHIRFLCPACQAVMEAPVGRAGDKIHCLRCGQRIQIPPAERARTILAPTLDPQDYHQPAPTSPLSGSSDRLWHYSKGGKQAGPISMAALRQMAASGQLSPTDMVWTAGMASWATAATIKGLFATPATGATVPSVTASTLPGVPAATLGDSNGPLGMPAACPAAPKSRPGLKAQLSLWTYLLFTGAGLMFIAFITPWWSFKEYREGDPGYSKSARLSEEGQRILHEEIARRQVQWYLDHFGPGIAITGFYEGTLWGWNTGPGLLGIICCILVGALIVPPLLVPSIARWVWIGAFLLAMLGFLVFLLSMIWFFRAPAVSMPGVVSQGVSVGLWFSMLGGLTVLIGGILAGLPGLRSFNANGTDRPPLLPAEGLWFASAVAPQKSSSRPKVDVLEEVEDGHDDAPTPPRGNKRHTGLIIGLSVGGAVLVAAIIVFFLWPRGLKSQILGKWEMNYEGKPAALLEFRSDGTFAGEFHGGGGRVDQRTGERVEFTSVQAFRGTFTIAGDVLLLHPIERRESGFERGSGDAKRLKTLEFTVKIKGDTMTLTAIDKHKSLNSVAFTRVH